VERCPTRTGCPIADQREARIRLGIVSRTEAWLLRNLVIPVPVLTKLNVQHQRPSPPVNGIVPRLTEVTAAGRQFGLAIVFERQSLNRHAHLARHRGCGQCVITGRKPPLPKSHSSDARIAPEPAIPAARSKLTRFVTHVIHEVKDLNQVFWGKMRPSLVRRRQ
jgi:hypothetical protein